MASISAVNSPNIPSFHRKPMSKNLILRRFVSSFRSCRARTLVMTNADGGGPISNGGADMLGEPVASAPGNNEDLDDEMKGGDCDTWADWEDRILQETAPVVGFVRMILHSGKYGSGDKLSPEHEKTILEKLLPFHPKCEEKIGCGVDYITKNRSRTSLPKNRSVRNKFADFDGRKSCCAKTRPSPSPDQSHSCKSHLHPLASLLQPCRAKIRQRRDSFMSVATLTQPFAQEATSHGEFIHLQQPAHKFGHQLASGTDPFKPSRPSTLVPARSVQRNIHAQSTLEVHFNLAASHEKSRPIVNAKNFATNASVIFSGLPATSGRLLRPARHLLRLFRSATTSTLRTPMSIRHLGAQPRTDVHSFLAEAWPSSVEHCTSFSSRL
ncbi:Protein of unknown function (DUF3223 [Striga hermonthica]|uniref:Uncharacterized protein n=1 Tax=Striga hermonthica TaxID=68872 RepID=A0A9N7N0E1_STRHE|nr:Protein of unknown function (DUF3223 [Striga hermonthica]